MRVTTAALFHIATPTFKDPRLLNDTDGIGVKLRLHSNRNCSNRNKISISQRQTFLDISRSIMPAIKHKLELSRIEITRNTSKPDKSTVISIGFGTTKFLPDFYSVPKVRGQKVWKGSHRPSREGTDVPTLVSQIRNRAGPGPD